MDFHLFVISLEQMPAAMTSLFEDIPIAAVAAPFFSNFWVPVVVVIALSKALLANETSFMEETIKASKA